MAANCCTVFTDIIERTICSPPVSSLLLWESGLHFCATGTEGLVVPQLRTQAAGFPRPAAAATSAGSPTSVDHLQTGNSALAGEGKQKCHHFQFTVHLGGKHWDIVIRYHMSCWFSGRQPEPTGWIQKRLHSWLCRCKSQCLLERLDLSSGLERCCFAPADVKTKCIFRNKI